MKNALNDKQDCISNSTPLPQFLNAKQAARKLDKTASTIRAQAARGELPAAKFGRRWVFIDVDLVEVARAQYRCAISVEKKEKACQFHSTEGQIANFGGLLSHSQTGERYADLLKLPTARQPKHGLAKRKAKYGNNSV